MQCSSGILTCVVECLQLKEKAIAHGSWHSAGRPLSAKPLRREVEPSTDDEELFGSKSNAAEGADGPEIVRTKYFMLDPMTPAEAVELVSTSHPHYHHQNVTDDCYCYIAACESL